MTNSCSINDNSCSKVNKEIGKNPDVPCRRYTATFAFC